MSRLNPARTALIEVASDAETGHQESAEETESEQALHHTTTPSEAPVGRTLEHETLEDEEMEFHPMPENLEAMSEVAGDLELDSGRGNPRRR